MASSELEQRKRAVVVLYGSLTDYDFQPETSTGAIVRKQAKPGGRNRAKETCGGCKGEGRQRRRGIAYLCDTCHGRGWEYVDQHTRRPIGTEETGTVATRRWVACDGCGGPRKGVVPGMLGNGRACAYCSESGRPGYVLAGRPVRFAIGTAKGEPELDETDPVFRCLARRKLAGSYDELILATRELRQRSEQTYRLVAATYIERRRGPRELPAPLRRRLDAGLVFVAVLMPDPIRVPARAKAQERLATAA